MRSCSSRRARKPLPSTRALVAEHGASPVTVQRALRSLQARGLVETRPGVGAFVREAPAARPGEYGWQTAALGAPGRRIPPPPAALRTPANEAIALHSGYPSADLLPERLVRAALVRAARGEAATSCPPAAGLSELRAWFAAELRERAPSGVAPAAPGDVVVVPGSQSGLSAVFQALVGEGGALVVESPTYWGAILAAARAGVRLVPIPSGPGGPDPDELARALDRTGARVFYAQPGFANPTGALWSAARAERILAVVSERGAFLVEDDWAHDFGISAAPVPVAARDGDGHVVYLRSLTKSVSPTIRVAGVVARGPARDRILSIVQSESMYVSPVLQAAALDVVSQPAWRAHLRGLRPRLELRRDLLIEALREHAPGARLAGVPSGGLHLWLRLPDHVDLGRLVGDCELSGLMVAPGDGWFPAEPTAPHVRLGYAGADPARFPEAARILGEALGRQG